MANAFSTVCASLLILSVAHAANMSEGGKKGSMPRHLASSGITQPGVSGATRPLQIRTQPPAGPSRQIVVRKLKVDNALLDRLANRPVALPSRLSPNHRKNLDAVALRVKRGDHDVARKLWEKEVASYASAAGANGVDIEAMIMWVLRESYREQMEVLKYHAEKVQYYNNVKNALREHLKDMRESAASMDSRNTSKTVEINAIVRFPSPYRPGAKEGYQWTRKRMTRVDFHAYIKDLERRLATVGDDAQLAQVDMQNNVQKQQQLLQMMSTISKILHDTAMSVIRKMGG